MTDYEKFCFLLEQGSPYDLFRAIDSALKCEVYWEEIAEDMGFELWGGGDSDEQ